ncbi:Prolycopene isomerase 1 [Chlorella vulgaris]
MFCGCVAGSAPPACFDRDRRTFQAQPLQHRQQLVQECAATAGGRQRRRQASLSCRASAAGSNGTASSSKPGDIDVDVVVIGSGIGGLSCAALLARYGVKASTWQPCLKVTYVPPRSFLQVVVCESHDTPGGAAHAWTVRAPGGGEGLYHFESGPSLYSDMGGRGRGANPLAHVLQALDEPLDLLRYKTWNVGATQFCEVLQQVRGPEAVAEWQRLQVFMRPLADAAAMLPPVAFRQDAGAALTAVARYLPSLLSNGGGALKLTGPFSKVLDEAGVKDPFIRNWLDLLCFLLSGLPADGTIAAAVAFMFNQWYQPDCYLEFPRGGSQAMVDALVRGLEKHGGRLLLRVRLRGGRTIRASRAVVSNASTPDTLGLVPEEAVPDGWRQSVQDTPLNPSFMHLHLGFDATGLEGLELHHLLVNSWDLPGGVTAEQNVVLVSIASVIDPSLAPPGKHTLHAYLPATEPYELWAGLDRRSDEYKRLKQERSKVLWNAVRTLIPDIDSRVEVELVGTPLTHQRFLRRSRGSYGPATRAGEGLIPWPATPLKGLYCCGDFAFPGIGLPAVAASGAITANTLVSVGQHRRMLEELGL